MNILILTEHRSHSRHNSLYKIAVAIWQHPAVENVFVASRNDTNNADFFAGQSTAGLRGILVDETFGFPADEFFETRSQEIPLTDIDALFLRIPHPINLTFFDMISDRFSHIPIINHPKGILAIGNKAFLLSLDAKYIVPMALCENWEAVVAFSKQHDCVLKPVLSYGGKGILRIVGNEVHDGEKHVSWQHFEQLVRDSDQPFLAMQYLRNINQGDKRIVVVNGEILSSSLRMPAKGGWLANVAQGGSSHHAEVDDRDREIVAYLSPILKAKGIFYYGLDTIISDEGLRIISEINSLSIGGIAPVEEDTNQPLSARFAQLFINYLQQFPRSYSSSL